MTAEEVLADLLAAHWPGRRVVVPQPPSSPARGRLSQLSQARRPSAAAVPARAVPALHNWFTDYPGELEIHPHHPADILTRRKNPVVRR